MFICPIHFKYLFLKQRYLKQLLKQIHTVLNIYLCMSDWWIYYFTFNYLFLFKWIGLKIDTTAMLLCKTRQDVWSLRGVRTFYILRIAEKTLFEKFKNGLGHGASFVCSGLHWVVHKSRNTGNTNRDIFSDITIFVTLDHKTSLKLLGYICTTLKAIFSIFRFFCTLRFQIFK